MGDIVPKQPGLTKADVVRIIVDDVVRDGPTRRSIMRHTH
jgi:hypothetical protein